MAEYNVFGSSPNYGQTAQPTQPARASLSSEEIRDLEDDLAFNRAVLASLADGIPGLPRDPREDASLRAKINTLELQLRQARASNRATGMSTARQPQGTYSGTQASGSGSGSNSVPRRPGTGAKMSSGASTPSSYGSRGESPAPSTSSHRKRDFSTHQGDTHLSVNGSKSRRTSPAPFPFGRLNGPATPNSDETEVIDLTLLDDDEVPARVQAQQQKIHEAIMRQNRVQKQDAAIARQLNGPGSNGIIDLVDDDDEMGVTPQAQAIKSEPTWFDRIQGRTKGPSSSNTLPGTPTRQSGSASQQPPAFGTPSQISSPLALRYGQGQQSALQPPSRAYTPFPSASTAAAFLQGGLIPKPEPISSTSISLWDAPLSLPGLSSAPMPGSYPAANPHHGLPALPSQYMHPASMLGPSGYTPNHPIDVDGLAAPDWMRNVRYPWEDEINDAQAQEELRELLTNIRPDEDVAPMDRENTPRALRTDLYAHQALALAWMKKMEEGKFKGGILADDMGLGKTISTLALMVSRPSENLRIKTNLIVGPVALIRQWQSEIKAKLKQGHQLSVYLLHGASKRLPYDDLKRYDVVLTTYGTIANEWKRFDKYRLDHKGADFDNDRELHQKCPLLHAKSRWYRIILDEAQCIKNKDTQSARGTMELTAEHRWCLSGTPMMNGVHELFSLFRFLRITPYNEQKKFTEAFQILNPKSRKGASDEARKRALKKLQVVLKACMLRRKKDSKIDGKPILNLPPKVIEEVRVGFSQDESDFYNSLEKQSQVTMNKYLRAGTVGKNYSNVLALLLRLRQACCHPHLLDDYEVLPSGTQDGEGMKTLAKTMSAAVVERIRGIEAFECPICMDGTLNPAFVLPCGHESCIGCLQQLFDNARERNMQAGQEAEGGKCPQCRGGISLDKVIDYDTFKEVHMGEGGDEDDQGDDDDADASETDSEAEEDQEEGDDVDDNGNLKDFVVDDDFEDEDEPSADIRRMFSTKPPKPRGQPSQPAKKPDKVKKPKKDKGKRKVKVLESSMLRQLRKASRKNIESKKKYMKYLRHSWVPSAKVDKACELLENIQKTGEKTIIFSVWTSLLDLLEIDIKQKLPNVKFSRYDGGLSAAERNRVACAFQEDPQQKVMLISLKAGNSGLNLTAASHVIMMDPFWNPYVEMQAVDRAHRIGQMRPVHVHRLLVENPTVEERIMELQDAKKEVVEAALDEGESRGIARLSAQELGFLFGLNARR